jgi:hypothetical protein
MSKKFGVSMSNDGLIGASFLQIKGNCGILYNIFLPERKWDNPSIQKTFWASGLYTAIRREVILARDAGAGHSIP